jgi:FeS assembly SUF system protein
MDEATETTGAGENPDVRELETRVVEAIKTCYDPEIPVDIYSLGLIYGIDVSPEGDVTVRMTLTSPACPVAGTLPGEVELKIRSVPGVRDATIELVWDPPWDMEMMSEAAKLELGFL